MAKTCICCGCDTLQWDGEHQAEEYGWVDREGWISEWHCENCGAEILIYVPTDKERRDTNN